MAEINKQKVLIIEDEDLIARMYEKTLSVDGFEVEVAIGGNEGLEKAKSFKPDVILLDIMMPEPDGMEVLETLKRQPETSEIPVVMLTNLSGKQDAELAIEKGAVEYWIKKEAKPSDFGTKIKEIISQNKTSSGKN